MAASGFLLALTRDEARRLFGLRGDDAIWSLIAELNSAAPVQSEGRKLDCGQHWANRHAALAGAGEYPLDHCLLGGREMTQDQRRGRVLLKRPDTAAHLAETLSKLSAEAQQHGASQDEPSIPTLSEFYGNAAARQCAVLFVVVNEV